MRRRVCIGLFAVALGSAESGIAQGENPRGGAYRLSWRADEQLGCPSSDEFSAAVAKRLGTEPFNPAAAAAIEVEVFPEAQAWSLSLRWVNADGSLRAGRTLSSAVGDCHGLVEGAVFLLELMLAEGEPSAAPLSPEGNKPDGAPAESSSLNSSSPRPVTARTEERETAPPARLVAPRWNVQMLADAYVGVLPRFGLGVSVAAGHRFAGDGFVTLELGISQSVSTSTTVDDATVEFSAQLVRAGAGIGWFVHHGRWMTESLGVLGHFGSLGTGVRGIRPVGTDQQAWAAIGFRAMERVAFNRNWSLVVAGELVFPLLARQFGVVEGPVIAQLSPVGGVVGLGLNASF